METFFDITSFFLLLTSIGMGFVNFKNAKKTKQSLERLEKEYPEIMNDLMENFGEVDEKVVLLSNQIDRSMLALRELLEPTKPTKTNNWDSMREAFKGPTRVDVNERN